MSATENQESMIPENGKPVDQSLHTDTNKPKEASSIIIKGMITIFQTSTSIIKCSKSSNLS